MVSGHTQALPAVRILTCLAWLLAAGSLQAAGLTYRIEGVDSELRANLQAHLGSSPQDQGSAERFLVTARDRAARALEALGYYEHGIDLSVDRDSDTWRATITVIPGEALRYTGVEARLEGQGAADPALQRLVEKEAPAVGDIVHHGRYETFKGDLQQLARQRGYFDAEFREHRIDIDVAQHNAELRLLFAPGMRYGFGELLADEALLPPEFLDRVRPFDPGSPYTQGDLLELRQRLLRLGYFSSVVVLPEVTERDSGLVPIRIDVVRAPSQSFEVGVGFSTDTRQRFSLQWRTPRLNRYGHSQQTALRWSPVNPELRMTYSVPLDDPAADILQGILRFERNEFGDLLSDQQEIALRRERTSALSVQAIQLRVLGEDWDAAGEDFSAGFVLAGASYSRRSRRGSAVDPEAGLSQFYDLELASASLGSDEDLVRLHGEVVGVHRFSEHWRIVARGEAGLLVSSSERPDQIPPSLAFFAGGDRSIRGYAYQSVGRELPRMAVGIANTDTLVVGGTRLATGSLEVQRYLNPRWRLAAFVDAGDAFVDDDFDLNVGVGLGIHYLSPVGALRFEIADPVTSDDRDWRVHINIGAEF